MAAVYSANNIVIQHDYRYQAISLKTPSRANYPETRSDLRVR